MVSWCNSSVEVINKTYLVAGLVELLGIKRGADAKSDTGAEQDVVGDGGNTAVVDLGLFFKC